MPATVVNPEALAERDQLADPTLIIAALGENPPSAPEQAAASVHLELADTYQIWHALDERAAQFERDAELAETELDRLALREVAEDCERLASLFSDAEAAVVTITKTGD